MLLELLSDFQISIPSWARFGAHDADRRADLQQTLAS